MFEDLWSKSFLKSFGISDEIGSHPSIVEGEGRAVKAVHVVQP